MARVPDGDPNYYASDTLWIESQASWPSVGVWGLDLQRRILQEYKVPTCVINGAVPGSGIQKHILRDSSSVHTIYELLRFRIRKSGTSRIRAFFWLQGEEDVLAELPGYTQKFDTLYHYWQQDYPMVDTFVVLQTNLLTNPNPEAGVIRDFHLNQAVRSVLSVQGLPPARYLLLFRDEKGGRSSCSMMVE